MKNLSETNYFVIFLILLFIHPVVYSYNSKLYSKIDPGLTIDQEFLFEDGTVLMNLLKPINETCAEPHFNFRVLHPNGTLDAFKIDYLIPEHNFCSGPESGYLFIINRSRPKSLYVLYINSTDISSASYYILLISQMGDPISPAYIAPTTVINGNIYPNGIIRTHISEEYGFIFSKHHVIEPIITWSYFDKPNEEGKINLLRSGKIHLNSLFFDNHYEVFSGIDGSYGFLTFISNNSTNVGPGPAFKVFLTFIRPIINKISDPVLIYSSSILNLVTNYDIIINCNSNYYPKTINVCIFGFENLFSKKVDFVKLLIRDSGAVVGEKSFKMNLNENDKFLKSANLIDLANGGYLLYSCVNSKENNYQIFNGIIFDNNENYNSTLDFPLQLKASKLCQIVVDSKVAYLFTQNEMSWQILITSLPKFFLNNEYENLNIESTYPLINLNISLSITNINITYNFPIQISQTSLNNISIYQYYNDGNPAILRQSIPVRWASFFSYSSDGRTINMKVLNSTFNQPNSNYYVVIDDYTVRKSLSNEPLLGIRKNLWNFNTISNKYKFADEMTGRFALTTDGANYFQNLSSNSQKEFLLQLKFHLSKIIPVDINRLNDIECCKRNDNQILLSLPITSTTNLLNEKSVDSIINDLHILIQQKNITAISWYNTTNCLDEKFGFRIDESFKDLIIKFKFHILGITIGIIILFAIYLLARRRYYRGKNIVILLFPLTIFDLISDILFIVNDGKKISHLFIPSIIFCVLPIAINIVIGAIILSLEFTKNHLFYTWFKNNINTAILFALLTCVDLKALDVLSSQVGGIMMFNVDLSERAQSYMFWGSIIGLIIEDIPQFIIQILYKKSVFIYNAIPFVTLGMSSLTLMVSISIKVYHLYKYFKKRKSNSNSKIHTT